MRNTLCKCRDMSVKMTLRAVGFALVMSALATSGWAEPKVAPEMDPGLAMSAMALLGGGLALVAGRKRAR